MVHRYDGLAEQVLVPLAHQLPHAAPFFMQRHTADRTATADQVT